MWLSYLNLNVLSSFFFFTKSLTRLTAFLTVFSHPILPPWTMLMPPPSQRLSNTFYAMHDLTISFPLSLCSSYIQLVSKVSNFFVDSYALVFATRSNLLTMCILSAILP